MVGCSQCGQTFGAGDSGYSACSEHRSRQDLAAAQRASTAAQAAAKAESEAYTRGTWSVGPRGTCVVSTDPIVGGVRGTDDVGYYGGHLIAETVTAANARRIVACVNACAGIATAALELCGTCIDTPEQGEHL